ncbi:MAG: hypothetical protein CBB68_15565 [Rhodospirillaceae bacterium TMED8]|mgnify:CR=1 FL=1|nr:MAG: hypothetical protein CBB68_15565 [Rhodospirillaceae bacterium TMED8]
MRAAQLNLVGKCLDVQGVWHMNNSQVVDVLVIGLGPAGSCASRKAAEANLSVLAIDRRKRPGEPVQCAEFVPALMGQEIKTSEVVRRQSIREMTTFVENGLPDSRDDFRGQMIDRGEFDRDLIANARHKGADCQFGLVLRSIAPDGTALLSSGKRVYPKVIIGADGPRSAVGYAIGHSNSSLVAARQMTVPLLEPHRGTDIFLSADIVGGYGWMFPKGDRANIGVGVSPAARGHLKPLLETMRKRLLRERRIGNAVLGHTGGEIPVGGMVKACGRLGEVAVFLAGDAAGLANPITGAGIPSAVISGELAGEAAASSVGGDCSAGEDYVDELSDIFDISMNRALRRRQEILGFHSGNRTPIPSELRRTWIAYNEYWAT